MKGTGWGRPEEGIAGVVEGLSAEARTYLAAGGLGVLIGDGQLNYRAEKILEAYYAYRLGKWTGDGFPTPWGEKSLFRAWPAPSFAWRVEPIVMLFEQIRRSAKVASPANDA